MESKPLADQQDSPSEAAERPRRVIKRYSNRKLYDTKDSRYVTLLQIAAIVRGGEEVQIIDNNSKEDLTEVTLAQIIYEEQKQKATSRSVPLQTLKELIHQRTEKVLGDLRESPLGRLIPGTGKGDEIPGSAPPTATTPAATAPSAPSAPATAAAKQSEESKPSLVGQAVEQAKGTLEDWQHRVDERVKTVIPNLLPWQQLQGEIRRLNTRVEQLEAQVRKLEGKGEG